MSAPVASIDIGTNSTRLLVAAAGADGVLDQRERHMRITRLGQGVDRSRGLAPEAVERTLAVLGDYRQVIDNHGVDPARIRMAATSACRDASNRDEFFDAAEQVIGVRPELLSGEEEARLSFLGATADLDPALGPFLVFDLGGGSTEFVLGTSGPGGEILGARSTDFGCVRLTERFITTDPPAAEDVFRTLATERRADRLHNPGLEEARVDVIVGGCCALVAILRRLGRDEILVSESDILDGLASSLL